MSDHPEKLYVVEIARRIFSGVKRTITNPQSLLEATISTIVACTGMIVLLWYLFGFTTWMLARFGVVLLVGAMIAAFVLVSSLLWFRNRHGPFIFEEKLTKALQQVRPGALRWILATVALLAAVVNLSRLPVDGWLAQLIVNLLLASMFLLLACGIIEWMSRHAFLRVLLSRQNRSPFAPPDWAKIVIACGSFAIAYLFVYPALVSMAYQGAAKRYQQVNVYSDLLRSDPLLLREKLSGEEGINDPPTLFPHLGEDEALLRILQGLGMVSADMTVQDLEEGKDVSDFKAFLTRTGHQNTIKTRLLEKNTPTVGVVADLAAQWSRCAADSPYDPIVSSLVGSPFAERDWNNRYPSGINDPSWLTKYRYSFFRFRPFGIPQVEDEKEIVYRLLASHGIHELVTTTEENYQDHATLHRAVVHAENALSNAENGGNGDILQSQEHLATAQRAYNEWNYSALPANRNFLQRFLVESLARTHTAPEAKKSKFYVSLWQGFEQFAMISILIWGILLLGAHTALGYRAHKKLSSTIASWREPSEGSGEWLHAFGLDHLKQVPSADNWKQTIGFLQQTNYSSRWLLRWLAVALPAIGFVGTVRGISAGLASSDSIVRANSQIEQAAAITSVAGQLGVAFTTTLIALVAGLFLGLLERWQARLENANLLDVQREGQSAIEALQ